MTIRRSYFQFLPEIIIIRSIYFYIFASIYLITETLLEDLYILLRLLFHLVAIIFISDIACAKITFKILAKDKIEKYIHKMIFVIN